jgi:hypothetical protein
MRVPPPEARGERTHPCAFVTGGIVTEVPCVRMCAGMIAPSEDSAWAEEGLKEQDQPQQRRRSADDADR